MDAFTYTNVRKNFSAKMDKVCDDHAPIIITRQNAKPVIMMSLEDYNALEETLYLMRSPKNYSRLLASVENVNLQQVKSKELLEEVDR
jgi:antitoxin YefM